MKNYVVESYEKYREEDRLTTNNARKIEFLNTVRILEEHIKENSKILDCAAGTGIYAFHFAENNHSVTATDITPRHVAVMNEKLINKKYDMKTAVLDAVDLSAFDDESFDVVLNMGPLYHLVEKEKREQCMNECVRVLKRKGILATAYIPRFFIFQYIAMSDPKYLDLQLAKQLTETGVLKHSDEKCFWTDTYYSSKEEMEILYSQQNLKIVDHFAQAGLAPLLDEKVDQWNEEEFQIWCQYHYSVCREESILGASNHVIIIGEKQ